MNEKPVYPNPCCPPFFTSFPFFPVPFLFSFLAIMLSDAAAAGSDVVFTPELVAKAPGGDVAVCRCQI